MRRFPLLALAAAWALSCAVLAAPTEEVLDGKAILTRADAAIKAVESVRFRVKLNPTGTATQFMGAAEGETVLVGWNGDAPAKFYQHLTTVDSKSGTKREITGGGNTDQFFLIDHAAKKGYEDMDPGVLGSSRSALSSTQVVEFVHDRPFDDELGADTIERLEDRAVEGEDCYQVRVVYSGGQGESVWLFSKKDWLPRGRIRKFDTGDGAGTVELTLTEVRVDPQVADDQFVMKLPQGYQRIDDFAP
jgi:hypothetical protein